VTAAEPEWEGHLTLEISNISDSDVYLYAGEGIAQMIFFFGKSNPLVTYRTKKGKYQGQDKKIVVATTREHHEEVGNSSDDKLAPVAGQDDN
jgi:deoxycytidine triphosphate deaminase